MKEYCYVIVRRDGTSFLLEQRGEEGPSLPKLLHEGWRPVREMAARGVGRGPADLFDLQPLALVLLEREKGG
ncbi:MAG: hypothetical protein ACK4RK_17615 [Gemmataceae bacterium]